MHRRCHFLEECPYLKYNQGYAPGDPGEQYRDTSRLRSVLFSTMRREVAYFSGQSIGGTHERGRQYHQVLGL